MTVPRRIQSYPSLTALWARRLTETLAATVLAVSTSHVLASPPTSESSDGDWRYVDHDVAGTRYSHLREITTKNVSQIVKACSYLFPDKEPSQTAPIVSAGPGCFARCLLI